MFLHGKTDYEGETTSIDRMISELALEELAERYQVMLVIPYILKNCYYISSEKYDCEKFVSEELISYINQIYPTTINTEKILAGVSMGGYGAVLIGANTDVFDKVISVSGAFISNDILIGNPEVWGNVKPDLKSAEGTFLFYFLPLNIFEMSQSKNVESAILKLRKNIPFYFTCGKRDWLYSRNLQFLQLVKKVNIRNKFISIEGEHNNACFKNGLWTIMEQIGNEKFPLGFFEK